MFSVTAMFVAILVGLFVGMVLTYSLLMFLQVFRSQAEHEDMVKLGWCAIRGRLQIEVLDNASSYPMTVCIDGRYMTAWSFGELTKLIKIGIYRFGYFQVGGVIFVKWKHKIELIEVSELG